jgi:hypothetical protein
MGYEGEKSCHEEVFAVSIHLLNNEHSALFDLCNDITDSTSLGLQAP